MNYRSTKTKSRSDKHANPCFLSFRQGSQEYLVNTNTIRAVTGGRNGQLVITVEGHTFPITFSVSKMGLVLNELKKRYRIVQLEMDGDRVCQAISGTTDGLTLVYVEMDKDWAIVWPSGLKSIRHDNGTTTIDLYKATPLVLENHAFSDFQRMNPAA